MILLQRRSENGLQLKREAWLDWHSSLTVQELQQTSVIALDPACMLAGSEITMKQTSSLFLVELIWHQKLSISLTQVEVLRDAKAQEELQSKGLPW